MSDTIRFPLLVLREATTETSRARRDFDAEVRNAGGYVATLGARYSDVVDQVRTRAPSTHVLFLGSHDTPVPGLVSTLDSAIWEDFLDDVVYAHKQSAARRSSQKFRAPFTAAPRAEIRLPAWSPHRLEFENYIGDSFLIRVAFFLSLESELDPSASWDSWEFLRVARRAGARGLRREETWFDVRVRDAATAATAATGVPMAPSTSSTAHAFAPTDCSLITLTAGASDATRSHVTLVDEHLDVMATTDAAAASHVVVLGPECPASLRVSLQDRASRTATLSLIDVTEPFNFAARCNVARTVTSGAITVLVNDDFVPLRTDWLTTLIEPFNDPHVGITGATLLYADDTIQHIGVGVDGGNFHHSHVGEPLSNPRVAALTSMNREVDAVTGACLAVRTDLFDEVGGLSEGFPLNFNDIDLCLKVRAHGHSVVLVGAPLGYHLESRTRAAVALAEEMHLFYSRWPFRANESEYPSDGLATGR